MPCKHLFDRRDDVRCSSFAGQGSCKGCLAPTGEDSARTIICSLSGVLLALTATLLEALWPSQIIFSIAVTTACPGLVGCIDLPAAVPAKNGVGDERVARLQHRFTGDLTLVRDLG